MLFEDSRDQTNFNTTGEMEREAQATCLHRDSGETLEIEPVLSLHSLDFPEFALPKTKLVRGPSFTTSAKDATFAELHFQNLVSRQHLNRFYKENLVSVSVFREEMLTFVWTVCKNLKCSLNTYYLAVSYLDVIFAHYSLNKSQSRVCAYSAVILAAKLEEKVDRIPQMSEAIEYFENAFDEKTFLHYEDVIFRCLSFQLNVKTPFTLMNAYLTLGVVTDEECLRVVAKEQLEEFVSFLEHLAGFFLEIAIQNYEFNKFSSQVVAAASIVCAKRCLGLDAFGAQSLNNLRLEWSDLEACVEQLLHSTRLSNSDCYRRYAKEIHSIEEEITRVKQERNRLPDISVDSLSVQESEKKRVPFSRENTASTLKNGRKPSMKDDVRSSAKKEKFRPTSRRGESYQENEFHPVTPAKGQPVANNLPKGAFSTRKAGRNLDIFRSQ